MNEMFERRLKKLAQISKKIELLQREMYSTFLDHAKENITLLILQTQGDYSRLEEIQADERKRDEIRRLENAEAK